MAKYATLHVVKKFDVAKLKKIIRDSKRLAKTEVTWGWINGKAYNAGDTHGRKGIPYAVIATRNEYGGYYKNMETDKYIYIPSRPYFQQSTKGSVNSIAKSSKDVVDLLFKGENFREKLDEIGKNQVEEVKKSVARNNFVTLHKKTIALKDSSRQWYDTGAMMKNVTHKVKYHRGGSK